MDKSRRSPWKVLSGLWSNYSFIFIFVVIFLAYYLVSPRLTWTGITNILRHSADVGIIALGMGLVVITGQIDLSVGSMLAFVGGCTIMVYNVTNSILLAFLAAVVCGTVCGLINGVLVGRARNARLHRHPGHHAHLPQPDPLYLQRNPHRPFRRQQQPFQAHAGR